MAFKNKMKKQKLDRRLHPYRPDLAAEYLRGRVEAEHFVIGRTCQIRVERAPVRTKPDTDTSLETELLFGELVQVYEEVDGWAWIQSKLDDCVGYTESTMISDEVFISTHSVSELATYLYPEPNIKSVPITLLPMTARVAVKDSTDQFCRLRSGGWVHGSHIEPISSYAVDHCAVARKFLNTPYLWGGKTNRGIDCSGLLQVSLARCGIFISRDTDLQLSVGRQVEFDGDDRMLQRGDLVFWPGHVGIWMDSKSLVHASASTMLVTIEPLHQVSTRIGLMTGQTLPRIRRVLPNVCSN